MLGSDNISDIGTKDVERTKLVKFMNDMNFFEEEGRHEKALEIASSTNLEDHVWNSKDGLGGATEEEILAVSRDYGGGRSHSRVHAAVMQQGYGRVTNLSRVVGSEHTSQGRGQARSRALQILFGNLCRRRVQNELVAISDRVQLDRGDCEQCGMLVCSSRGGVSEVQQPHPILMLLKSFYMYSRSGSS